MSTIMDEEKNHPVAGSGDENVVSRTPESGALAALLDQPPVNSRPLSLRQHILANKDRIRAFIDGTGSWDALVAALSSDLKRPVNRKTVETYVSDVASAKDARKAAARNALPNARPIMAERAPLVETGASVFAVSRAPVAPMSDRSNPFAPLPRKSGE